MFLPRSSWWSSLTLTGKRKRNAASGDHSTGATKRQRGQSVASNSVELTHSIARWLDEYRATVVRGRTAADPRKLRNEVVMGVDGGVFEEVVITSASKNPPAESRSNGLRNEHRSESSVLKPPLLYEGKPKRQIKPSLNLLDSRKDNAASHSGTRLGRYTPSNSKKNQSTFYDLKTYHKTMDHKTNASARVGW